MYRSKTCLVLLALIPLTASAVEAGDDDRLGGAFRGPYESHGDRVGPYGPVPPEPYMPRPYLAAQDTYAYWMFWFEHNKEALLSERVSARRVRVSRSSSADWFSGAAGTPVTAKTKREVILPLLARGLSDVHPWVRNASTIALGKLGGPAAAKHLPIALDYPEPELREDALLALGLCGEPDVMPHLLEALCGSDEPGGRRSASYAALGLGLAGRKEALPLLLRTHRAAYREGEQELAGCAALALGLLGTPRFADVLAQPIRDRRNTQDQIQACHALGRLGGGVARTWLFRALSSRDMDVQAASILALSGYPAKPVVHYLRGRVGLKSFARMKKLYAIWSLSRIAGRLPDADPVSKLIRNTLRSLAENIRRDRYQAMHAGLALAASGDSVANDTLLEQFSEGWKLSVESHSAIAMTLGLSGDRRCVEELRRIAQRKSEDQDLRGYVLFALALMKDKESLPLIRELMVQRRQRHQVLRSGCWALGLLGDATDIPRLMRILSHDEYYPGLHCVRGAAAIAIGLIGDESAVAPLVGLVRSGKSASTAAFAIAALGWLIDKDPVPRIPLLYANFHYRRGGPVFRGVMSIL